MDEKRFQTYMLAARSLGGDYGAGYQRGLRRHYHGERFGTDAEHEAFLSMGQDGYRTETGDGYRDGAAGRPPRGLHANAGNTHAQIADEPATAILHVRCTPAQKARWVKTAQRAGMRLSEWVVRRLDAE